jgi:hypothetical protein
MGVTIRMANEYVRATIAPLGGLMRHAGKNGSGEAGHAGNPT